MIEISFVDADAASAGLFAQRLQEELVRDGVSPTQIRVVRADPTAMDLGSVLQVAESAWSVGSTVIQSVGVALTAAQVGKLVWEVLAGSQHEILVKDKNGQQLRIKGTMSIRQLHEALGVLLTDKEQT